MVLHFQSSPLLCLAISVCDYYLHDLCQEFAVPNCVESATFDPAKSLTEASKSITHHFQVQKETRCMITPLLEGWRV